MTQPFVIGVTGPIASGKSAVTRRLAEHGAVVLDADLVYRDLVQPGMELTSQLAERFGAGILADDGGLNRRALGAIVFSDQQALADLDRLTHPAIIAEIGRRLETIDASLTVIEAVKLSRGTAKYCDETWLVTVDPERQLERLMARNGIDRADAERRIASQMDYDPDTYTRVIPNNESLNALRERVDAALALARPACASRTDG